MKKFSANDKKIWKSALNSKFLEELKSAIFLIYHSAFLYEATKNLGYRNGPSRLDTR